MKLILVQYRPAIRLYKWAITLKKLGHDITIGYTTEINLGLDWSMFNCVRLHEIKDFSIYDRYISFNPNIKISHTDDTKVIQAVGDLKNANSFNQLEIENLKKAYSCIFVSEEQLLFAEKICGKLNNSFIYYNGVIPEFIGDLKEKLSSKKLNLVYSGTIVNIEGHHRNIIEELRRIKNNNNCNIHIYLSQISNSEGYEDFIIHKSVSPKELISELSQYDAGIFVLGECKIVSDMALPNKVYEYLSAGIPVVAPNYKEISKHLGIYIMNDYKIPKLDLSINYTQFSKQYNEEINKCLM